MNYSEIYKRLPKVLGDYIAMFNVEHRKNMFPVLDELYDHCNLVYCDNDMCEREVYKEECIQTQFSFMENVDFYFCCESCESYGTWSIHYDYRKSRRQST